MLKSTSCKVPGYIVQKLLYLLETLKSERDKYAQTASKITDRQLRDNINTLAQENNQYACELLSQLQMLGTENYGNNDVDIAGNKSTSPAIERVKENDMQNPGSILQFCRDSEKRMIGVYREILNEPYLMEDMRRLIRYQLNGIMYAFLRLKLFSSTF